MERRDAERAQQARDQSQEHEEDVAPHLRREEAHRLLPFRKVSRRRRDPAACAGWERRKVRRRLRALALAPVVVAPRALLPLLAAAPGPAGGDLARVERLGWDPSAVSAATPAAAVRPEVDKVELLVDPLPVLRAVDHDGLEQAVVILARGQPRVDREEVEQVERRVRGFLLDAARPGLYGDAAHVERGRREELGPGGTAARGEGQGGRRGEEGVLSFGFRGGRGRRRREARGDGGAAVGGRVGAVLRFGLLAAGTCSSSSSSSPERSSRVRAPGELVELDDVAAAEQVRRVGPVDEGGGSFFVVLDDDAVVACFSVVFFEVDKEREGESEFSFLPFLLLLLFREKRERETERKEREKE